MGYTKYRDPWTVSDDLEAKAFNHIETQFSALKEIIDAHNHNDDYYLKATSDTTFFSTSFYTGFDADKLDGFHYSQVLSAALPVGAIMIWSGTDGNVPSGWVICNGGSGSPDLRDRFVIGAGSTYSQGQTGGAFSTAISGSVTIGSHAVTNNEIPLHTHGYIDRSNYCYSCYRGWDTNPAVCGGETHDSRTTGSAGSGGGHNHPGSSISLNNLNCVPPYYALYYIYKVS